MNQIDAARNIASNEKPFTFCSCLFSLLVRKNILRVLAFDFDDLYNKCFSCFASLQFQSSKVFSLIFENKKKIRVCRKKNMRKFCVSLPKHKTNAEKNRNESNGRSDWKLSKKNGSSHFTRFQWQLLSHGYKLNTMATRHTKNIKNQMFHWVKYEAVLKFIDFFFNKYMFFGDERGHCWMILNRCLVGVAKNGIKNNMKNWLNFHSHWIL